MKLFDRYMQDEKAIGSRLQEIRNSLALQGVQKDELGKVLGILDMTTLEGSDHEKKVVALCHQARFSEKHPGLPDAAAVCVYPTFVRAVRWELAGSSILSAAVAGAFPSGQSSLHVKLEEVRFAIDEGAQEIDTVISRGKLLAGQENEVFDEIAAIREACGDVTLKVILETGELGSVALVRRASEIAILAGADFIKTSTGKIAIGATPEAFLVMADTIREYLEKTGKAVGIKAAGGVRLAGQALEYAAILRSVLGDGYFSPQFFRIGASSLAGEILNVILAPDLDDEKKK